MDAVKFIKERDRMCCFYHHAGDCYQCPAKDCECSALEGMVDDDNIVAIVEEWSAAHPSKTRQQLFLEQYPDAQVDIDDILCVCPAVISPSYRNEFGTCASPARPQCSVCRRKFWTKVVGGWESTSTIPRPSLPRMGKYHRKRNP